MRIAFAGRFSHPITGAESVPINLLRELVILDTANEYTLFVGSDVTDAIGFRAKNLTLQVYNSFWQKPIWNIVWHQLVLPAWIQSSHFDVLFVPHNRVPLIKNCVQVVVLYDLAEFRVERKYDWIRNLYRQHLLGMGVRRAERVVTISKSSKQDIAHFLNVADERIARIYIGVNGEYGSLSAQEARQRLADRYPIDKPYFLYVGALEHPNKNLVRLLQAYHQAQLESGFQHNLLLVGPKRWRTEFIFTEIEKLHLQDRVFWVGYVPQADLPGIYAGADAFIYVSLWEGFGLPVLEAMASGVPVIASNTSSLPEVVGDAGILVDPQSVASIATAMKTLVTDEHLKTRLRIAGPARAKMFSWRRSAEDMLEIFEQVSGSKRSAT
jgi:glycosyltransferase involved in cell wall biosynthesis